MTHSTRSIIRITGDDHLHFLQGILTQDVTKLADEKIQFAALLSPQGKIVHDMFLVALEDAILIDTATESRDTLMKRLAMYKLRAKVTIADVSDQWSVTLGEGLPDPRHPQLPHRDYRNEPPDSRLTTHDSHRLGIPELGRDFAPDNVVAMDAGYDLLHAISFSKGCYVGQEITARMRYKNIARRGFFMVERDGEPAKLALLKFEDFQNAPPAESRSTIHDARTMIVDNVPCRATLPEWMLPKFQQFLAGVQNQ